MSGMCSICRKEAHMSSLSGTKLVRRVIGASLVAATLAGCSDIYYDRRETVALSAGDAVATNKAIHIIDPWPRHSANRNLAFNGERMQRAVECYRANKVTTPVDLNTSNAFAGGSTGTPTTRCVGMMDSAAPPSAISQTNGQSGNTNP
jgi:hypothetical protein